MFPTCGEPEVHSMVFLPVHFQVVLKLTSELQPCMPSLALVAAKARRPFAVLKHCQICHLSASLCDTWWSWRWPRHNGLWGLIELNPFYTIHDSLTSTSPGIQCTVINIMLQFEDSILNVSWSWHLRAMQNAHAFMFVLRTLWIAVEVLPAVPMQNASKRGIAMQAACTCGTASWNLHLKLHSDLPFWRTQWIGLPSTLVFRVNLTSDQQCYIFACVSWVF